MDDSAMYWRVWRACIAAACCFMIAAGSGNSCNRSMGATKASASIACIQCPPEFAITQHEDVRQLGTNEISRFVMQNDTPTNAELWLSYGIASDGFAVNFNPANIGESAQ